MTLSFFVIAPFIAMLHHVTSGRVGKSTVFFFHLSAAVLTTVYCSGKMLHVAQELINVHFQQQNQVTSTLHT